MFPMIGPVATTNDVTYVTPSYVVDHSPRVGQAGHFRSWPRGWITRIGPVATTNDVTYVTPSYVVDHSPRVGQAGHFRSWPRGWINRIGPVAIFNVSGPSYEIVYMPELSHLLCVCRVTTNGHYLIYYIRRLLTKLPNVTIEWVPSHCGIMGNERADSLAGASLNLTQVTNIQPPRTEIRRKIMTYYSDKWQNNWTLRPYAEIAFKPDLIPPQYTTLNRCHCHQVPLTRLRLGVTQLSHGHYFTNRPPPSCPTCNTTNTPDHHILTCPRHNTARVEVSNTCRQLNKPLALHTILSPKFPTDILVTFLQSTGLLEPGAL